MIIVFAAMVALTLIVAIVQSTPSAAAELLQLPAGQRTSWFARAQTDVSEGCLDAGARTGAVRQHCVDQARFLLLFPDCAAGCKQLVARVLPHRR